MIEKLDNAKFKKFINLTNKDGGFEKTQGKIGNNLERVLGLAQYPYTVSKTKEIKKCLDKDNEEDIISGLKNVVLVIPEIEKLIKEKGGWEKLKRKLGKVSEKDHFESILSEENSKDKIVKAVYEGKLKFNLSLNQDIEKELREIVKKFSNKESIKKKRVYGKN